MNTTTTYPDKSEKMYSLISQCAGTGMTVKQFCHQQGIATGTYYYWYKKYHTHALSQPQATGSFELLNVDIRDNFSASVESYGVYAEYKGIRFYREPSASLLKSLIS